MLIADVLVFNTINIECQSGNSVYNSELIACNSSVDNYDGVKCGEGKTMESKEQKASTKTVKKTEKKAES